MGWSPSVCGGRRHGIISVLDSRQTLELSQGASVSSMTVFCGRPSLAVLPRHSMPGNICKQWPPTKEPWLCGGSLLTGIDVSWDGCWPSAGISGASAAHRRSAAVGRGSWAWWGRLPFVFCFKSETVYKSYHFSLWGKSFAIPGVLPRKEDTYKYTKTQQDLVFCKRKHDYDISPENEESFFFDAKLLSLRNNTRMQFCADRTWVLKWHQPSF